MAAHPFQHGRRSEASGHAPGYIVWFRLRRVREWKQDAFVSPTLDDLTFVYPPGGAATAEKLSRAFHCPALFAAVYDSDYFEYDLYQDGHLLDHYNNHTFSSDPHAEPEVDEQGAVLEPASWWGPTGGDARRLCAVFAVESRVDAVEAILHPTDEERIQQWKVDSLDHHTALAEQLGWPMDWPLVSCRCLDYYHLKRDGIDADLAQVVAGGPHSASAGADDAT